MSPSLRPNRSVVRTRLLRSAAAALGVALAVGLSACAQDPATEQYLAGDNKGYIGAAGLRVDEIPADQRTEPVEYGGTLEDGSSFSSEDVAGDVVVVNFWYAACGPCRVEAKDLEAVWQEYQDQDVSFIGVNTYDQADTARAFAEQYGVTYPSLIDVNTGEAKLAFAQATTIQATPTTLVLDRQGRVAARIVGQLEEASILSTLVKDALAEKA
ncbi:TlpA family protein disulfide reductase [Microbacterium resistens]|uniref:TlpA family protein disulfide reductase n=1 Tax=Microbacterium resistens TaxID=156977 RepID=A0ABY3RMK3_9MICO|nr:TlpA disulfide reductase family protein [Microbacterium resistens]MDA4892132.1 TlpA disulfide reductase family protein [Streptomyces sp. MS2A]UGS25048.1 TlpA family protein disulfide reductase [Microbacterium resistens]